MQLMINTSSCKYYCVRSCMYVRAQVCDTLPIWQRWAGTHMVLVMSALPHHPAFSGHQITLLTHCTACMRLFFYCGTIKEKYLSILVKEKTQRILKLFVTIPVAMLYQKTKIAEKKLRNNQRLYLISCTEGCHVRF